MSKSSGYSFLYRQPCSFVKAQTVIESTLRIDVIRRRPMIVNNCDIRSNGIVRERQCRQNDETGMDNSHMEVGDGNTPGEKQVSIAGIAEIKVGSPTSFGDAVKKGLDHANETLDDIEGAWVRDMKYVVSDDGIEEYRVNLKVSFVQTQTFSGAGPEACA